ncbi:putative disease resistance protein RDL5, partial [Bienertia sinuspersici]
MAEAIMFLIVAQNIRTMIDEDSNSLLSSVRTEAQALNNELTKLEEHVAKAETNSPNTNEQVRARFAEARRIVYDAEDVVDKFVSKTESSAFSSVRLLPRSRKDSKKLRRLRDQITGMMATIDNGSPRDNESPRAGNELAVRQAQRHVDDEFVVGIEADVDKLYRAWVSLPKEWGPSHEKHLLLELLVKMGGSGRKIPIDHLQQNPITMVQNLLENKKCLVVLDDVWNWEYLQEMVNKLLLPSSGVSNSKIVITSRQFLPSPDNKWIFHETKLLSNEDSFTLFNKVSSSGNKRELAKEYQGLAKEMLIKCKGLPLAIVALGKLLKKKDTIEEWERVFSQFEGKEGSYLYGPVTDILALSYYELPDYLKPFFLYLGLLVEEHINASALKRMWVAEGFVKNQQKEGETPEKAATRLLQELVNHTMVQPVTYTYTRKVKTVQVHNLMRDVCVMIAQELDFLTLVSNHPHSRRAAIDL